MITNVSVAVISVIKVQDLYLQRYKTKVGQCLIVQELAQHTLISVYLKRQWR